MRGPQIYAPEVTSPDKLRLGNEWYLIGWKLLVNDSWALVIAVNHVLSRQSRQWSNPLDAFE